MNSEESYDWLATFSDLEAILKQFIRPSDRILIVGCGNSTFSADLVSVFSPPVRRLVTKLVD